MAGAAIAMSGSALTACAAKPAEAAARSQAKA